MVTMADTKAYREAFARLDLPRGDRRGDDEIVPVRLITCCRR